ncbi:transglycosylase domain-containing protein [Phytoactinopolyspora halotolerans]|uniref:Penicillin-binding protein n=1 Tax=Phytoactinopolyspora halotolerans TaxID=1981512 RepID=A0A6L9SDU5_9ACTN|nr:transglycosylase domain-containing protein [Phytoactinopolyspora halotolerans]NEE03277.1 penicillin-binding protein [Phytoactinopolyspora halotolerans]
MSRTARVVDLWSAARAMAFSPVPFLVGLRRVFVAIGVSALCGVLMAGIVLPVVGALGLGARVGSEWFDDMTIDFEPGPLAETSRILDADGRVLATFFDENRDYVELDEIADVMIDAILAVEDDRFFERGPIDFQGTLRAFIRNVEAGETQAGGSTLTQQYVKLVRVSQAQNAQERSSVLASDGVDGYRRKLDELRMAISVEQEYTKEEILERYLNIAFFGSRAYGVEAAARTYFSVGAGELTLAQAALLAGIVQSPNRYDPNRNPDAALARRNVVLGRMAETGMISELTAAELRGTDLDLKPRSVSNGCVDSYAGFYCDYVVNEIRTIEELGSTPEEREHALTRGGLTIESTLRRSVQRTAEGAVSERVAATDEAIASLAAIEPGTGDIQALANSREYGVDGEGVSNFNYAVDRDMGGSVGMQPGSAAKAFVLAAAVKQGIGLGTSFSSPAQISVPISRYSDCDGRIRSSETWRPKNYDGGYGGIDVRTATERSVNTFFAQLAVETGLCEPAKLAQKMGAGRADGSDYRTFPASVLGANEVSPLGMAQAYATFANRGVHCQPRAVVKVKNRSGKVVVDRSEPDCERVLEKNVADTVNSVLEGVVHNAGGTGGRMQLEDGRRAAGKTGTTNGAVAVWFVGYTPQLATAVAVADVDGDERDGGRLRSLDGMSFNGEQIPQACGGCIPGPIWKHFMDEILEGEPKKTFNRPRGITRRDDSGGGSTPSRDSSNDDAGSSGGDRNSGSGDMNSDTTGGGQGSSERTDGGGSDGSDGRGGDGNDGDRGGGGDGGSTGGDGGGGSGTPDDPPSSVPPPPAGGGDANGNGDGGGDGHGGGDGSGGGTDNDGWGSEDREDGGGDWGNGDSNPDPDDSGW